MSTPQRCVVNSWLIHLWFHNSLPHYYMDHFFNTLFHLTMLRVRLCDIYVNSSIINEEVINNKPPLRLRGAQFQSCHLNWSGVSYVILELNRLKIVKCEFSSYIESVLHFHNFNKQVYIDTTYPWPNIFLPNTRPSHEDHHMASLNHLYTISIGTVFGTMGCYGRVGGDAN